METDTEGQLPGLQADTSMASACSGEFDDIPECLPVVVGTCTPPQGATISAQTAGHEAPCGAGLRASSSSSDGGENRMQSNPIGYNDDEEGFKEGAKAKPCNAKVDTNLSSQCPRQPVAKDKVVQGPLASMPKARVKSSERQSSPREIKRSSSSNGKNIRLSWLGKGGHKPSPAKKSQSNKPKASSPTGSDASQSDSSSEDGVDEVDTLTQLLLDPRKTQQAIMGYSGVSVVVNPLVREALNLIISSPSPKVSSLIRQHRKLEKRSRVVASLSLCSPPGGAAREGCATHTYSANGQRNRWGSAADRAALAQMELHSEISRCLGRGTPQKKAMNGTPRSGQHKWVRETNSWALEREMLFPTGDGDEKERKFNDKSLGMKEKAKTQKEVCIQGLQNSDGEEDESDHETHASCVKQAFGGGLDGLQAEGLHSDDATLEGLQADSACTSRAASPVPARQTPPSALRNTPQPRVLPYNAVYRHDNNYQNGGYDNERLQHDNNNYHNEYLQNEHSIEGGGFSGGVVTVGPQPRVLQCSPCFQIGGFQAECLEFDEEDDEQESHARDDCAAVGAEANVGSVPVSRNMAEPKVLRFRALEHLDLVESLVDTIEFLVEKVKTAEAHFSPPPSEFEQGVKELRSVQIAVIHDNFREATARVLQCKRVFDCARYRDVHSELDEFNARLVDAENRSNLQAEELLTLDEDNRKMFEAVRGNDALQKAGFCLADERYDHALAFISRAECAFLRSGAGEGGSEDGMLQFLRDMTRRVEASQRTSIDQKSRRSTSPQKLPPKSISTPAEHARVDMPSSERDVLHNWDGQESGLSRVSDISNGNVGYAALTMGDDNGVAHRQSLSAGSTSTSAYAVSHKSPTYAHAPIGHTHASTVHAHVPADSYVHHDTSSNGTYAHGAPSLHDNRTPSLHDNRTPSLHDNRTPSLHENRTPSLHDNVRTTEYLSTAYLDQNHRSQSADNARHAGSGNDYSNNSNNSHYGARSEQNHSSHYGGRDEGHHDHEGMHRRTNSAGHMTDSEWASVGAGTGWSDSPIRNHYGGIRPQHSAPVHSSNGGSIQMQSSPPRIHSPPFGDFRSPDVNATQFACGGIVVPANMDLSSLA